MIFYRLTIVNSSRKSMALWASFTWQSHPRQKLDLMNDGSHAASDRHFGGGDDEMNLRHLEVFRLVVSTGNTLGGRAGVESQPVGSRGTDRGVRAERRVGSILQNRRRTGTDETGDRRLSRNQPGLIEDRELLATAGKADPTLSDLRRLREILQNMPGTGDVPNRPEYDGSAPSAACWAARPSRAPVRIFSPSDR